MFSILEGTAIDGLVTALNGAINMNTLLGSLTALVSWIAGVVLFAFVYGRVRKSIKGASQGKAKI